MSFFLDGNGITPGTAYCKCYPICEYPCWQRVGIAPSCERCGCGPFAITVELYPWLQMVGTKGTRR